MPIIIKRILAGIIDFYIACAVGVTVVAIITLGELPMTVFTATVYSSITMLLSPALNHTAISMLFQQLSSPATSSSTTWLSFSVLTL